MIKNKYWMILFLAGILLGTGCKKTLDINQNPNVPALSQANPQLVFPAAVMNVAGREGGDLAILGAIWGQYVTQSALANQYKDIETFNLTSTSLNTPYTGLFTGGLKNFQYIINTARSNKDWSYFLMGWVMKAYTTGLLVDLYDKIPYSEALQGTNNLTPHFDDGYAIYEDLIKGLDSAATADLGASTNSSPGTADLVFGGDMSKWVQFANTLELKLYLRMVNAKPQEAQAGVQKLYNRGGNFLTTDAGVSGFTDQPAKDNPLYEQNIRELNTPNNLRASRTLVSYLRAHNDTARLVAYFGSTNPGSINQGDFLSTDPSYRTAAVFVEHPTDPVIFLSSAESYFMQAEARARYYGGDQDQALYNQGVIAAFNSLGIGNGAAFVAPGGPYEYPAGGSLDQKIAAISTQKWASFPYGVHFIEGYFEKQRTGYPVTSAVYSTDPAYVAGQFVSPHNSVLPAGQLPRRLVFPDVEVSRNPNTPTQVPITTPVWWAKP